MPGRQPSRECTARRELSIREDLLGSDEDERYTKFAMRGPETEEAGARAVAIQSQPVRGAQAAGVGGTHERTLRPCHTSYSAWSRGRIW